MSLGEHNSLSIDTELVLSNLAQWSEKKIIFSLHLVWEKIKKYDYI